MTRIAANGIEIEYETFGDPHHPVILLISGWGAQLLFWDEEFCARLAARGFHVIRFDSRDAGLSTSFDELGVPDVRAVRDRRVKPPYTLDDMADDAVGLLDGLGIDAAHVLGISIGGYIAQLIAINHSGRVRSLISMASAVDAPETVYAPSGSDQAPSDPPPESSDAVERRVDEIAGMSSPAYFDRARIRAQVVRARARSVNPDGAERQAAAVHASSSRFDALGGVTAPVLVLHGALDVALPVENANRTAEAAPGARLVVYPDMNHDLPPQLWDRVIDDVAAHANAADLNRVVRV